MTCAYAVRVALKKFPGVESVDVNLNQGLATVKLKPGNTIQPQQFWQAIHKNGFTPKDTHVVVRGEILPTAGKPQLKVSGTDQVYAPSLNNCPKADTVDKLEHKKRLLVLHFAVVEDLDDIWMVNAAEGLSFLAEFFNDVLVLKRFLQKNLDYNNLPEDLYVTRNVNGSHPASAKAAFDMISAFYHLTDQVILVRTHSTPSSSRARLFVESL